MDTVDAIKRRQRDWAVGAGLWPDAKGYLPSVRDNLFQAMTAGARDAFGEGKGQELRDGPHRPAKMRALHSSAALVVNVFDYWVCRDAGPLGRAMGMKAPIGGIALERRYPTGLGGTAPHLDIVITLATGAVFALESKFTEWLSPKTGAPFRDAYFAGHAEHWAAVGLPECQRLAQELRDADKHGRELFRHLDAPQLLKHALGLGANLPRFSLGYIHYDAPGDEARAHRRELQEFQSRVGPELGFTAVTYQLLFKRLKENARGHSEYLDYLGRRYFPNL